VRSRSSSARFGGAAGSIDGNKRARLIAAARMYLSRIRGEPPCRFDVVTMEGGAPQWIKAAFEVG
jgi:putative endonuclease